MAGPTPPADAIAGRRPRAVIPPDMGAAPSPVERPVDAFDHEDFDAVQYINEMFPTGEGILMYPYLKCLAWTSHVCKAQAGSLESEERWSVGRWANARNLRGEHSLHDRGCHPTIFPAFPEA
jgi:hypothetical protein